MLVGRRYVLSGRVQRVGFRYFAFDAAEREGLTGFVRNLPDGQVEILVEGEAEAVRRFESAIRQGPRGARVDAVETDVVPPTGRRHAFDVIG
ncbi:MAG: acylphosphatase [Acidobacteria bacterium]|nr:MAG: acylphosphatase [Acidobacteriota bacterium]